MDKNPTEKVVRTKEGYFIGDKCVLPFLRGNLDKLEKLKAAIGDWNKNYDIALLTLQNNLYGIFDNERKPAWHHLLRKIQCDVFEVSNEAPLGNLPLLVWEYVQILWHIGKITYKMLNNFLIYNKFFYSFAQNLRSIIRATMERTTRL
jgi:hypothetical protein